jgi:Lar family restriction alleviation protein
MSELKPCPFCGSKEVGVVETAYGNYANIFYFAHCSDCGARTKSFRDGDDAEEAWNRRADKE